MRKGRGEKAILTFNLILKAMKDSLNRTNRKNEV
jgi:hypothetical protein